MKSDYDKSILTKLGEDLRQAREKAGLTQVEVALSAGINPNYYAQMERGAVNSSILKINRAAKVLGITSVPLT